MSGPLARTPYEAALQDGLVVEASAGTGKTYALTTLVARLLVEPTYRIDQLLIVTFTVAATGELRTRVWETLRAARDAAAGRPAATSQARELAEHWHRLGMSSNANERLTRAIRDFDGANITTIHGFCQRALSEFALEAGLPFKFGVGGDGALEVESAARDFWRREMVDQPVPLLEYAKARKFLLYDGADWAGQELARSSALRPAMSAAEFAREWEERRDAWHAAFKAVHRAWHDPAQHDAFVEVWGNHAVYRWKAGQKDDAVLDAVSASLDANEPDLLPLAVAGYFGRNSLTKKLHQKTPPPDTPLFDHFERLGNAATALGGLWLVGRRHDLLTQAAATLHDGVWRDRQLTFDALLSELQGALNSDNADTLAKRIRERYPIALIDEFQDTDRLQARIFEAIYPQDGLIVVGDPKQSIFRFRGADVFAYVDARRRLGDKQTRLQLTRNYRSTPALVQAVNAVFQRDNALVLPEIGFESVTAADRTGALLVKHEDFDHKPFQVHVFGAPDTGKSWTKGRLADLAATHAANRIATLLAMGTAGKAVLAEGANSWPVVAGDIAVLVRTGDQGRAMIRALHERGIRTVEIGTDTVFDSPEAMTLHRLLQALATDEAEFDAAARLRGALAADLFGLNMADLDALREDDQVWAAWLERARDWRRIWASDGVASLLRRLLFADDPACAGNLLAHPDGPRRLTNFLHLTDLLHDAETRDRLSRRGLLDWFARFKARSERGGDTAQLRLESDEDLVKIVTVHRAKGLEFPIVFCPFAWYRRQRDSQTADGTAQYYDLSANEPVLDLQPAPDALEREQCEEDADEVRLLYVALTRAKYRCEVSWGVARDTERTPLAWLLDGTDRTAFLELVQRAPDAIAVDEAMVAKDTTTVERPSRGEESLRARELNRSLGRTRQLTSYSALTAGAPTHDEAVDKPDHDADEPLPEVPAEPALDVFGFPAGSRPGNCLHEILERHVEHGDLKATCGEALARYGIDAKWLPVAQSMVSNAWHAPLGTVDPTFRLADIDRPVVEMEFHLPVQRFRRAQLADILARHGYECGIPDGPHEVNGFLHGFIDLVAQHGGRWYVLDYKSNWLGGDIAAYDDASIQASMRQHGYHLQYLLYLTALDRLLRVRLPDYDYDRHIGGACYLFLRGMHPDAPGRGVHFDRPDRECIAAIDDCLAGRRDD